VQTGRLTDRWIESIALCMHALGYHTLLKMGCYFTGLNKTPWGVAVVSMVTSVQKAMIPRKWFDLCTQLLVATMAASYANTTVETFPL